MKQTARLLLVLFFATSCNGLRNGSQPEGMGQASVPQTTKKDAAALFSCVQPGKGFQAKQPITSIFQDKAGNFWLGTYGDGAYRYDGKAYTHFTKGEGLPDNFVSCILEDGSGNIWFCTKADGVCRYDGKTFIQFTDTNNHSASRAASCGIMDKAGNLWLGTGGGAYRYDGKTFHFWPLPMEGADIQLSQTQPGFNPFAYTVYCLLEDKAGNIWLGTAGKGLCCYNGLFCSWYKDKGLNRAALRSAFMGHDGTLWFGNNGGGVFCYDGKAFTNLTDEKGLGNRDFLNGIGGPAGKPGTLARVFAIGEDKTGNVWFGTIDAGAWRYGGGNIVNFTTKDGLMGNVIQAIYKDKSGNLWLGTDSCGLCKYDG